MQDGAAVGLVDDAVPELGDVGVGILEIAGLGGVEVPAEGPAVDGSATGIFDFDAGGEAILRGIDLAVVDVAGCGGGRCGCRDFIADGCPGCIDDTSGGLGR